MCRSGLIALALGAAAAVTSSGTPEIEGSVDTVGAAAGIYGSRLVQVATVSP